MATIAWGRHFALLGLVGVPLLFFAFEIEIPGLFVVWGGIHAATFAASAPQQSARRRLMFVLMASLMSYFAVHLGMVLGLLITDRATTGRTLVLVISMLASALGAAGYLLLIQRAFLQTLRLSAALVVVPAVCVAATFVGFHLESSEVLVQFPYSTPLWWFAFSLSAFALIRHQEGQSSRGKPLSVGK
jgi:hypothetical protein